MEAVTALLRVAARATNALAAIVARPGDEAPVAAWGCDTSTSRALLRAARRECASSTFARSLPLTLRDGGKGELILVAPGSEVAAIAPLVDEIAALVDPRGQPETPDPIVRLTETLERLGDAVAIVETVDAAAEQARLLYVNAEFTRLFGYGDDAIGRDTDILWGPQTDRDRVALLRAQIAGRRAARASLVLYTRDGTALWTELVATPVEQQNGPAIHHVITLRDVTSRKEFDDALAAEKRKLQTTLAAIADAVVTILPDSRVEFVNAAGQELLGIELADAYGEHVRDVLQLFDSDGRRIDLLAAASMSDEAVRGKGHLRTRNGTVDVAFVASRIDPEQHGAVLVMRDVTDEHRLALRLSFEAAHDPLTGLQNRRAFLERLQEAVNGARERGEHHAVGFLDLDRFKVVNDRFGHAVGDRLLGEIGRVMGRVVRGGDVIARIGGDEFALLLANCRLDDARRVAEKVRDAVDAYRVTHQGAVLSIGVSIGLVAIEHDTPSAEAALAEADAACYQAKAAGRNVISG